jgi:hypothetical protein
MPVGGRMPFPPVVLKKARRRLLLVVVRIDGAVNAAASGV